MLHGACDVFTQALMLSLGTGWILCNQENEQMHKSPIPLEHCREHAWVEPQLDVPWSYSLGKDPLSTR